MIHVPASTYYSSLPKYKYLLHNAAAAPSLTCTNAIDAGDNITRSSCAGERATTRPPSGGSSASPLLESTLYSSCCPLSATAAALVPFGPVRCHSSRVLLSPPNWPRDTQAGADGLRFISSAVAPCSDAGAQCAYALTSLEPDSETLLAGATQSTPVPMSLLQSRP